MPNLYARVHYKDIFLVVSSLLFYRIDLSIDVLVYL